MVLEATEMIPVGDEQHRRLICIQELLDELRSVKKRLATLEHWRDLNFEASPGQNWRSGIKGPFKNRLPLEAGTETVGREDSTRDRVGDGIGADGVLAESVDEEDCVPLRSPLSDLELVYAATTTTGDDLSRSADIF
jgi:hypothetical protein